MKSITKNSSQFLNLISLKTKMTPNGVSLEFSFKMSTRVHWIGTIYSRIDGLIRKGHISEKDRPIWFDIYKNFPPKYEPTFKRTAPKINMRKIFYKEDALRAKIHKFLPNRMNLIDLNSNRLIFSERLLQTCQQYISEGMSEEEALEKIEVSIKEYSELPKESSDAKKSSGDTLIDSL